ncbi:6-phosphogluconolactonase-like [Acanthaster planci]|uniref:6-phosphogluconolactonase n=1 Tax=Acanthaster planci TaxID=133434 RepID=A0A8B7ZQ67_ACAPL|nr:6-phosphogluconolactonase-like [Acanthaster planci]
MAGRKVHVLQTADIPSAVCEFVAEQSKAAVRDRGVFYLGVSGGSVAKFMIEGLPKIQGVEWDKWHVFFCDERLVPFDDSDSTYRIYRELIGKVNLPEGQIYPINPSLSVADAAKDYAAKVSNIPSGGDKFPVFDLLVLGMGPDGHTCSLFPGHQLLKEETLIVAPIDDSPKPPPCRVTLTYPVINSARCAMFASAGAGKADMVQRVLEGSDGEPLPAARVQLKQGTVHWFLDTDAASKLQAKY